MNDEDEESANCGKLARFIYQCIAQAPTEWQRYTPDAMLRVLVYIYRDNGFDFDYIKRDVLKGVNYYFESEKEDEVDDG